MSPRLLLCALGCRQSACVAAVGSRVVVELRQVARSHWSHMHPYPVGQLQSRSVPSRWCVLHVWYVWQGLGSFLYWLEAMQLRTNQVEQSRDAVV